MNTLIHGDCLHEMKFLRENSVDMILADPPYGTTACKWDSVIPLGPMWQHLKRVIKPNGAIVMTASQPFTTTLIASKRVQSTDDKGEATHAGILGGQKQK